MLPSNLYPNQVKAAARALAQSYGIAATAAQIAKAAALARRAEPIRPAVYHVGGCVVDLWRESCTCKAARARKNRGIPPTVKPCPHYLALYLSGHWSPASNAAAYYQSIGITQPAIVAVYVRAPRDFIPTGNAENPSFIARRDRSHIGVYAISGESEYPGYITARPLDRSHCVLLRADQITHVSPIYGD